MKKEMKKLISSHHPSHTTHHPEGISLISLIITIIVIIILAAIVIFSGLNTPDSASFAGFTQQVDNVYQAVMNKYGELKSKHAIRNEYRTDEQIYIEIATTKDPEQYASMNTITVNMGSAESGIEEGSGIQNIVSAYSAKKDVTTYPGAIGMTLPKVRESNEAWYVTKEGRVFNANGFTYDGKTYFSGSLYQVGELPSEDTRQEPNAERIYVAIQGNTNVVTEATGTGGTKGTTEVGGGTTPEPELPAVSYEWSIEHDEGNDGIGLGDIVAPINNTLSSERFYVLKDNGTTVTLLAERRLLTTATPIAQDGTGDDIVFNTNRSTNIYKNSDTIKNHVNNYVDRFTATGIEMTLENVDVDADGIVEAGVKGRLLLLEDLAEFNNGTIPSSMPSGAPTWIKQYGSSYIKYWLGSPNGISGSAWFVGNGGLSYQFVNGGYTLVLYGVRPVIEISKFLINPGT